MTNTKKSEAGDQEVVKADLPKATHSGELLLGTIRVMCHVLADGRSVVSNRGIIALLTGGAEHGKLDRYIDGIPNKPEGFSMGQIAFKTRNGVAGHGCLAEDVLVLMRLYGDAWLNGTLRKDQLHIGQRCGSTLFALAGESFVKKIHEATGYTTDRVAQELERKRVLFLLPQPSEYEEHFPESFWKALFRLYRRPFHPSKRPPFFADFVRRYVHNAVDKDMAALIKQKNPRPQKGSAHTQYWRVIDLVDAQIATVTVLMNTSANPRDFRNRFENQMNGRGLQLSFEALETSKPSQKKSR